MTAIAAAEIAYDDVRARRNAVILALGQALYSSATVIMFTTAGLVGVEIAPSKPGEIWAKMEEKRFQSPRCC